MQKCGQVIDNHACSEGIALFMTLGKVDVFQSVLEMQRMGTALTSPPRYFQLIP